MVLAPGIRLGVYEVRALIGAGGMGEVYRAHDTRLNRDVALKILPEMFAQRSDRLARFRREAQVLASLNHPNIGVDLRLRRVERRPRAGPRAGRGADARRSDRTRPARARRSPAGRPADRRCARSGPRARNRPPGSEARQHQDPARRHGQGVGLRAGQSTGRTSMRPRSAMPVADDNQSCADAVGHHSRHGRIHESRAGARQAGRQAQRHLGVWRGALRNAHRQAGVRRRRHLGHAGEHPEERARLERPAGGHATVDSTRAAALPGKGSETSHARYRRRAARSRREAT